MKTALCTLIVSCVLALPTITLAQKPDVGIRVTNAWVRATVPGAAVSAAYFEVSAAKAVKLVKVETPVAGTVELHDTKMVDGVMEMKAETAFAVPATQPLVLKPNGKHVMLFKLARQLKSGDVVPLTLTFENAAKRKEKIVVEASAREW